MNYPLITVEALNKVYQMGSTIVHALHDISFEVATGEFVALMGASGSGKSTLLHLLGCLDTPTNGRYALRSHDVSTLSAAERAKIRNQHIGFIFQNFNLLPRLTALENVCLPLQYDPQPGNMLERALEVLQQMGLADRAHHRPTELSGGQQQRVAIARALVTNPALILADEPTGNLDSHTGAEIMGLLRGLHENGRTLILVTHDPHIAAQASRTLVLRDGTLL